jgi:hypothetical protein
VRRSVINRMFDFMGRAAFGGENGFVRDKRLAILAIALMLFVIFSGNLIFAAGFVALVIAVLINDVRRYNREHSNG